MKTLKIPTAFIKDILPLMKDVEVENLHGLYIDPINFSQVRLTFTDGSIVVSILTSFGDSDKALDAAIVDGTFDKKPFQPFLLTYDDLQWMVKEKSKYIIICCGNKHEMITNSEVLEYIPKTVKYPDILGALQNVVKKFSLNNALTYFELRYLRTIEKILFHWEVTSSAHAFMVLSKLECVINNTIISNNSIGVIHDKNSACDEIFIAVLPVFNEETMMLPNWIK